MMKALTVDTMHSAMHAN